MDRLIFWDIDGTLLHCGDDGTQALNRTFRELFDIPAALAGVRVGSVMDYTLVQRIFERYAIPPERLPAVKEHYVRVLRQILSQNPRKRVLPGVSELLGYTGAQPGTVNALLTSNFRIGAMAKLESVGLGAYFQVGAFGDEPGEKWHGAESCLEELAEAATRPIDRRRVFLIGDSRYDMESAKRLGIRSIAVATGWTDGDTLREWEPDYFFEDLGDTERLREILGDNDTR